MDSLNYRLADEAATIEMGNALALAVKTELQQGFVAYLNGDLGAGKTTLSRGFVQAMGHKGNVKSPTYTLVEPYELDDWCVYHFDLYRLSDPEELEYMGIRDYFDEKSCCFVEWPEKGQGVLAEADLTINMEYYGEQRHIYLAAESPKGEKLLSIVARNMKG